MRRIFGALWSGEKLPVLSFFFKSLCLSSPSFEEFKISDCPKKFTRNFMWVLSPGSLI
jgi:hypothetical protein